MMMLNSTSSIATPILINSSPGLDGYEFSYTSKMVLAIVIAIVTLLGILGNTVVILIVSFFSDMHTLINFSFANLALTDLTLLLLDGVPTATDTIGWNLSAKLGCAVPIYLQYVVAEVTSLTLAFLSWDRYRLIVKPLESLRDRSNTQIYLIIILIWIASFVMQIPTAFVPATLPGTGSCNEFGQPWGQELFFSYATITLFIIPLVVIIPCYAAITKQISQTSAVKKEDTKRLAQRKKTIKWVFVVVIFYALMWLPCHMVHLWMAFDPDVNATTPLYIELHTLANVLMFINSAVNPYLYALAGVSFRKHLKDFASCFCCCNVLRRNQSNEQNTTASTCI